MTQTMVFVMVLAAGGIMVGCAADRADADKPGSTSSAMENQEFQVNDGANGSCTDPVESRECNSEAANENSGCPSGQTCQWRNPLVDFCDGTSARIIITYCE